MIDYFDRLYVLNLDRRPERFVAFEQHMDTLGWPLGRPIRFAATDGLTLQAPPGFGQDRGRGFAQHTGCAYASVLSHIEMLRAARKAKVQRLFIFEDDAIALRPDTLHDDLTHFFRQLPPTWDMVYLGGLVRNTSEHKCYTPNVCRYRGVLTTHAYGISAKFIPTALNWLVSAGHHDWYGTEGPIDTLYNALTRIHRSAQVFGPHDWYFDQRDWQSDSALDPTARVHVMQQRIRRKIIGQHRPVYPTLDAPFEIT